MGSIHRRLFVLPAIVAGLLALSLPSSPMATVQGVSPSPVFVAPAGGSGPVVAIRGYDVVGYFVAGQPIEGRPAYETRWSGVTWRFASAENRDRFLANPTMFAPAFGGFCAYAVANGYTAPVDPYAWDIVDGRLFLNYSKAVQADWRKNRDENIVKGDANWPTVAAGLQPTGAAPPQ